MIKNELTKGSIWKHYKGNLYELVDIAKHSETLEEMVVYRALYGESDIWVRPLAMWQEDVSLPTGVVKRFTKIKEGEQNDGI